MAGHDLDGLRSAAHERTQHAIRSPTVERTVDDRVDAAHHGGGSPGVVGVPVRHDEQVEPVDPEQGEAAIERRRFGAGVDERRRVRGPDDDRVALSDVAGRDVPGARPRRADHRRRSEPGADRHGEADREYGRGDRARTAMSPAGHGQADRQRRAACEQQRPCGIRKPGQPAAREPGRAVRHERDPRRGQPRDLEEGHADRRQHRQDEASEESDHRAHGSRRRRQQVGGHAVEGDRRVEQDEDGLAGELCGQRHREHHRERRGHHAAEAACERTGQEQQSCGRRGGEREPVVAREPRVEGEQSDDGDGEGRDAAPWAPHGDGHEHRDGHRAGTDDARLGRHEHDEAAQGDEGRDDPGAPAEAAERREGERGGRDDRAVRSRHRGEVAERARAHRRVELLADAARVADGEPGHECAPVAAESACRLRETRAQADRPAQPRGRRRRDPHVAVGAQPESALLGTRQWRHARGERESRADREGRRRQVDRGRDGHGGGRSPVDGDDVGVDAERRRLRRITPRRRADRPWSRDDLDDDVGGIDARPPRRRAGTPPVAAGRRPRMRRRGPPRPAARAPPPQRTSSGRRGSTRSGPRRASRRPAPRSPMPRRRRTPRHPAPRPCTTRSPTPPQRGRAASGRALRARPCRRARRRPRRRSRRPRAAGRRS